ncbi:hypothetical protein Aperf_G00000010081 [Anoplocephala perfoliata]
MPLSKRDKRVSLTKTARKSGSKPAFVDKVRSLVKNYKFIYVVTFDNSRNARITDLRKELTDSAFLFGKNKVISIALGRDKISQVKPGLYKLNKYIKGQCALLFSDRDIDDLRETFDQFRSQDYARPAVVAAQTVIIGAGPIPKFAHTLEPTLRELKLPVKLVRGIINLESDYEVCKMGDTLTPEQCRILKYFEMQISEFRVNIIAQWKAEDGKVVDVSSSDASNAITSLYPKVRVTCRTYEDGCHCFVPEPVEDEETTGEEHKQIEKMET